MIYLFLADGFEEIEALTPVDILRRANLEVQTVSVEQKIVKGAHGIPVTADCTLADVQLNDALEGVILPGGMPGTINLENCPEVLLSLQYAKEHNKLMAAICAAPSILGHMGYLNGKQAIAFPGFETELEGAELSLAPVCRDGNIITAKGMGVATEFALAIVSYFQGAEKAKEIFLSLQAMGRCE